MVVNIVLIFLLIFDTQYDGQDGNTANLFFILSLSVHILFPTRLLFCPCLLLHNDIYLGTCRYLCPPTEHAPSRLGSSAQIYAAAAHACRTAPPNTVLTANDLSYFSLLPSPPFLFFQNARSRPPRHSLDPRPLNDRSAKALGSMR